MKLLKVSGFVIGCLLAITKIAVAQIVLPEVEIRAVKYKYLNAVDYQGAPQPVRVLQQKAATYDIKDSDLYSDDYDNYYVSFYIPDGRILAAYDKRGKLLRTAEKYKNVQLPQAVREAVVTRFPQWAIANDVYLVNFYDAKGTSEKKYKLLLENGDKRIKVELNEKGEFN